jgi:hypothetical protein
MKLRLHDHTLIGYQLKAGDLSSVSSASGRAQTEIVELLRAAMFPTGKSSWLRLNGGV